MSERHCKDCLAELVARPITKMRPATYPGPRCYTHHKAEAIRRKKRAQEKRRQDTYGLSPEDHAELLLIQGGACAICQTARGVTRALAVDHDHKQAVLDGHDPEKGCPTCTRGLLCKSCNRTLGRFRDQPEAFERAAAYLRHPPAMDLSSRTRRARSASVTAGTSSARAGSSAAGAKASASSGEST